MTTTPKQARELANELDGVHRGHTDEGPSTFSESAIAMRSLVAQVEALTAELDAALSASRYETDLCGQALADLKTMTVERDALKADAAMTSIKNTSLVRMTVELEEEVKRLKMENSAKTMSEVIGWAQENAALKADAERFIHLARALSDLNALEAFEASFHGASMPDCKTVDEVRARVDAARAAP